MKITVLITVALSLGLAFASTSATTIATTKSKLAQIAQVSTMKQLQQPKAEYLFILQADKAKITKGKNGYTLVLKDIDANLLFFTAVPSRKTGLLSTPDFMKAWAAKTSSFQMNPPNMVFMYNSMQPDPNNVRDGLAIQLSKPVAIDKHSYSFQLTDHSGGRLKAGTYQQVSVFIDYIPD